MPFARKTLTQLRDDAINDINSAQITAGNGTLLVALLSKAVLRVVAYAQAGMAYEHYGFLDWISKQAVPWTAEDEFLEGWAALKAVTREPASFAGGTVTFPAASSGTPVAIGSSILRGDGFGYTTTAAATSGSSSVTVSIVANAPGSVGDFQNGTSFQLGTPIEGITATSTGSTQTTAGADVEIDDSLRTRMLQVYAAPPQGGDMADYIEWATAVSGVTRAWVAPNAGGAGTVTVYFMMDVAESAHGGFPQGTNGVASNETRDVAASGDQLTVANYIYTRRPVTALVYSNAPANQTVAFTVADLGANNTTAMQTAITNALTDMFVRLGTVGGTVNTETGAAWPAIEPDAWYAALEAIPGLTGFKVTVPSASISPSAGNLLTLGAITFVT